jgi:hypothetical protein
LGEDTDAVIPDAAPRFIGATLVRDRRKSIFRKSLSPVKTGMDAGFPSENAT